MIGRVESARKVFDVGSRVDFGALEHLVDLWCAWVEMELKLGHIDRARQLLQEATSVSLKKAKTVSRRVMSLREQLFFSPKLWGLYADVEETVGTFESVSAVYERCIELQVATPRLALNYGAFLEEKQHFEAAFRVYQRTATAFGWPNGVDVWSVYLVRVLERLGPEPRHRERIRSIFEDCIKDIAPEYMKTFYLMYASFEEEHGLARTALVIYERYAQACREQERRAAYSLWIVKATDFVGVIATRPIYQKALEALKRDDGHVRVMCVRFAALETRLCEMDRARRIFAYGARYANPKHTADYWDQWKSFELEHGSELTLRDMARIRRDVEIMYDGVDQVDVDRLAADGAGRSASTTSVAHDLQTLGPGGGRQRRVEGGSNGTTADHQDGAGVDGSMGGGSFMAEMERAREALRRKHAAMLGGDGLGTAASKVGSTSDGGPPAHDTNGALPDGGLIADEDDDAQLVEELFNSDELDV